MKAGNRNALLALALALLMALIVPPLARREAVAQPLPRAANRVIAIIKRLLHRPTKLRAYTGPMTNFLGQSVPAPAEPYLVSAVKCARQVDAEASKYPTNSHPYQLLKALEKKLFADDYAYAALAVGSGMDRTNALAAYEKLAEQAVPDRTAPLARIPEASADLEVYYSGIVNEGHTDAYWNIVQALSKYTRKNPLATDLFKDAALYAGLREQANGWIENVQAETDMLSKKHTEQLANEPTVLSNLNTGFMGMQDQRKREFKELQESYRKVLAYRLADRHGLADPTLFADLNAIQLKNAGPELVIPVQNLSP
jgi:hypothetical protein